jgi:hypothetical protein
MLALPTLDNRVDLSRETWTGTGALISGDCIVAVEGWVKIPARAPLLRAQPPHRCLQHQPSREDRQLRTASSPKNSPSLRPKGHRA